MIYQKLKQYIASQKVRQLLLWCLPALILGLALRVILSIQLPYAYFHDDTPDFLYTAQRLMSDYKIEIHGKKTFLVPLVFSIPFVVGLPALVVIPIFQHLLGLGLIVIIGAICRLWFSRWKIFIIPLTLLIAANPFLLWYEHSLMAETMFIFCLCLAVLAGTLYAKTQSKTRFAALIITLFLTAGARPEGKLFFGFGLLLVVLLHFRTLRADWWRVATVVAVAAGTHLITKSSQATLLLYTSVARLTPAELKCAPGFEPYIAPIRIELQERWDTQFGFPRVLHRRKIDAAVEQYVKDHPINGKKGSVDAMHMKLATETCFQNFFYLPVHIYHKFRAVSNDSPSGKFDNEWLVKNQREAYLGGIKCTLRLGKELTGQWLNSESDAIRFFDTHYQEVGWFNALEDGWLEVVNYFRFSDIQTPCVEFPGSYITHKGVPFYFLVAGVGLIVVMFRKTRIQKFHIAWGLGLLAVFYIMILTGNVRARFRLLFEPFWYIYMAILLECVIETSARIFGRKKIP